MIAIAAAMGLLAAVPSTPYDPDTLISYHCLPAREQEIVDLIYGSLIDHRFMVSFDEAVPEDALDAAIENIMFDYPELFFIDYAYDLYWIDDESMITDVEFHPTMGDAEIDACTAILLWRAEEILSRLPADITDYEKELWIHDYLCREVAYSTESAHDYTPQGALLGKAASCEGYAESFALLLRMAGIPCSTVSGTSFGEPHEWNIARISGSYTYVDVTWDDMGDYISRQYLNVPDDIISRDHRKASYYLMLPAADTMEWNWHRRNGLIVGDGDDAMEAALALVDASAKTSSPAEYRFGSAGAYRAFEEAIGSALQEYADAYGDITYWTVPDETEQAFAVLALPAGDGE